MWSPVCGHRQHLNQLPQLKVQPKIHPKYLLGAVLHTKALLIIVCDNQIYIRPFLLHILSAAECVFFFFSPMGGRHFCSDCIMWIS